MKDNEATKQVVIVGLQRPQVDQLQRLFGAAPGSWQPVFAGDFAEALALLDADARIGAVVCGTDGEKPQAELLELRDRFPSAAILRLSGHAPSESSSGALPVLSASSSPVAVQELLERTHRLQRTMTSETVRSVVGSLDRLPSVPATYHSLMQAAAQPRTTVDQLAALVQTDPAMSLKVLQLVNSTFFGLKARIGSISQAIGYLGIELLKALVLSAHVFSALDTSDVRGFSLDRFQLFSIRTARLGQRFASSKKAGEEAFTAGILHDIGELVLAVQHPDAFSGMLETRAQTGEALSVVERKVFGVGHEEVGAYVLSTWGIPFSIVECAAYHHRPGSVAGGDLTLLAAVHAADALLGIATCGEPEEILDTAFIERAGCIEQLPRWRKTVEEQMRAWS